MKKMSETIVFFGNERLATGVSTSAPTLQALIAAGYAVAAVVSNYTERQSRNTRPLEIKTVAEQHDIPVLLPDNPLEIKGNLQNQHASIGVLVAYGKIVPQEIIDIFPRGIINIHPSLLPQHRGPTPIESVILSGESKTGVSLMKLVKEMDAGPVFAQKSVALTGKESKQQLASKLLGVGKDMLIEHLPAILNGSLVPKPQDVSMATYDARIEKDEGIIEWNKPAEQLEREVRAFLEWPKSRTKLGDKEVIITRAHVTNTSGTPGQALISGKSLIICCGKDALAIDALKPTGRAEMSAAAFLAGYGTQLKN